MDGGHGCSRWDNSVFKWSVEVRSFQVIVVYFVLVS